MFDFFKKATLSSADSLDGAGASTHFHSTRREGLQPLELANLVLSDTVNRNGIPKGWLQVECLDIDPQLETQEIHLQLVMRRWSEQLLRYSAALQQQFIAGLDHFEPNVDHSHFVVSWRFAQDCALPSALIPECVAWYVAATGPA